MRSEEICELLEHESTPEFSDFTEEENIDDKVDDHAFLDSFSEKMMMQIQWHTHHSY